VTAPALSARGVSFRFGERPVLSDVSLAVSAGEVVILLGPNGAGKSTLLRLLSGTLRPDSGEVRLLGRSPSEYPRREMARRLSVAGQDPPLDFPMTVGEYVALGRFPHLGMFGGEGPGDREKVARALSEAGLEDLAGRPLAELSAGERQRAAVARAIAQDARVMLFDEPTAFLDIRHRVRFHEIVERLAAGRGVGALVASHDLALSAEYGDRIVLLSGGSVLAEGMPAGVLTPGNIRAAYGVEVACDRNPATGAVRVSPVRKVLPPEDRREGERQG
jgi:iron complex transport system ATP-binding protein